MPQALAEALQRNRSITNIRFGECQIGDAGAQARFCLECKCVFYCFRLLPQVFAEALKHNSSIITIDFCRNDIGDLGAQARCCSEFKFSFPLIAPAAGFSRGTEAQQQHRHHRPPLQYIWRSWFSGLGVLGRVTWLIRFDPRLFGGLDAN